MISPTTPIGSLETVTSASGRIEIDEKALPTQGLAGIEQEDLAALVTSPMPSARGFPPHATASAKGVLARQDRGSYRVEDVGAMLRRRSRRS